MVLYICSALCTIVAIFTVPYVFIASGIFLIISVITQITHTYQHEDDMNIIWEKREDMSIQKRKSKELLDEFTLYLARVYPNLEKEIIKSMKPGNVSAYMIKYPELKSSETICKLVDLINSNKSKIYEYETLLTSCVRRIKSRMYSAKIWVIVTSRMERETAELMKSYERKI